MNGFDRRKFIGAAAAAGMLGAIRPANAMLLAGTGKRLRVGVVGGGIVGASIAWHLAEMGAEVIVFEKDRPGMGTTAKSLAWINPFVLDKHYAALRLQSMMRWKKYDAPLGMGVTWGGYINWTDVPSEKEWVESYALPHDGTEFEVRRLTRADFRTISPSIDPGNLVFGYLSKVDGHVDPVHATQRYLAAAQAKGAKTVFPCEVTEIGLAKGKLTGVRTTRGAYKLDRLVIANSNDAPVLLAKIGYELQMQHKPGVLVHSKPIPILSRMVYDGPGELEWKQMSNGSIVGMEATRPPANIPAHAGIIAGKLDFPPGMAEEHGRRILKKLAKYMPGVAQAEVDHVTLGYRPLSMDGFPVAGPVPNAAGVSTCVTHSGVTLSMIMGEYMAKEALTGGEEPMLAPYRPLRYVGKGPMTPSAV